MCMAARRKYRWEDWFDRPTTTLEHGVHYHCSQSTMAGMVRNAASQRGLRVKVVDKGNSITITVVRRESTHPDKAAVAC